MVIKSLPTLPGRTDVSPLQVTNSETGMMSSNNDGCETEDQNGSSRNVEDKTSPDLNEVLNEIQMQKTHDLYCPNCIRKVTETAKVFEKGEATFPYNKERFILRFVIVLSFKYPFIYFPWLHNNAPDGSDPTQRVVDEMPRKHVLDWLLLLLVLVLLLLSATVLWVLLSPTQPLPLPLPLPPSHIDGNSTILTPDPFKKKEEAADIHEKSIENSPTSPPIPLPPLPPNTNGSSTIHGEHNISKNAKENHGHLNSNVLHVVEDGKSIENSPSSPPLPLPPLPPNTNGSSTIHGEQKLLKNATENHGHLHPDVIHDVEDDKFIENSPPSPPLPLPPLPPNTNGSSTIHGKPKIPENATENNGHLHPDVIHDVEDHKSIENYPPSPPLSLPPLPPNTNGSSTIHGEQKIPENATENHGHLHPDVLHDVEDDISIENSPPSPPLPLPPLPPNTNESSKIHDEQKIPENAYNHGHLHQDILHDLKDDKSIENSPPSPPLPLPPLPPNTSRSSTIHGEQKLQENATENHGYLHPDVIHNVEDDKSIENSSPSPPLPIPPLPPNTDGSSTIHGEQKIPENATENHGHLHTDVLHDVEDDKSIENSPPSPPLPLPPLPPNTNGSSTIHGEQKILENATDNHGHLHSDLLHEVEDDKYIENSPPSPPLPLPPLPTNTNGSSIIHGEQKIPENATDNHGHLHPDVLHNVEDKSIESSPPSPPLPLLPPNTNGSSTIHGEQKLPENATENHGHLHPYVLHDLKDDKSIDNSPPSPPLPLPPLPPNTHGCSTIHGEQKLPENATENHDHLHPNVIHDVEDDKSIENSPPSPPLPLPPLPPNTDGSSTIHGEQTISENAIENHGHLHTDVLHDVEDDKSIEYSPPSPPLPLPPLPPNTNESSTVHGEQKIPENATENHGHLHSDVLHDVEDDKYIENSSPSPPLPSLQPNTNGSSIIHGEQKIPENAIDNHGHLHSDVLHDVEDEISIENSPPSPPLPLPPLPPNTNGSSTIHDEQRIPENATENHGHLHPDVIHDVEDDKSIENSLPSPPLSLPPLPTNINRSLIIHSKQKIPENTIENHGHLHPDVLYDIEDDKSIENSPPSLPLPLPPLPPNTNGSVIIHGQNTSSPNITNVVEHDSHIPPSSPPSLPPPLSPSSTNASLRVLIPDPQNNLEDITHDRSKPDVPSGVQDDRPISPSLPPIKKEDGLIPLSWVLYIRSNQTLFVISLLFLSILALCLLSISWKQRIKTEDGEEILGQEILVIDILKSIVYGGLIESITSFGVVSSAAASGTSTFNVLALGVANLFSGLFLIIYNLYGLIMSEPFYQNTNIDNKNDMKATDVTDPYEELLGNRNRVPLHCALVLISFLLFAVIPPLFYGFSHKITDKGHYEEVAVVVAVSLVCVISLSFAKAYAFGMDKLKTVAVYTGIAVGASALSFVASQHARYLFGKYDVHKLASDYPKG